MTLALIAAAAFLALVLSLTTFVQLLYMEGLRLRSREAPVMAFFKEMVEDAIGLRGDQGVLYFSLLKHSTMVVLVALLVGISAQGAVSWWRIAAETVVFGWILMIVACYIVPQILFRKTTAQWLWPLTPVLKLMTLLVWPVAAVLRFLESLVDLGETGEQAEEPATPTEHIEALISAGAEEGLIQEEDRRLIQSVVEFSEKTVREVMTPRPDIVAIEQDKTLEDLRDIVLHEQFSRIPVYEQTIDQIAGFVHVRDMFELDEAERQQRKVKELMRPIRAVPETKKVNDLLREMQEDGAHMAVVIDEYGNTAGLATMEDLVEEIFGEIRDEHEPAADVREDGEGRYIVSGSYDLDGLHDLLGVRIPQDTESTTIGGLATEWFGRVPKPGESVDRDGLHLEVMASNELRVDQVRVSKSKAVVKNGE